MTNGTEPTPFKIGIWGTSRGGKTTYLAMLYHVFLSQYDTWEVRAKEDEGRVFVEKTFEEIFNRRAFPDKTVDTRQYRYSVRRKTDDRRFTLEFLDAPGELVEAYYNRSRRDDILVVAQRETEPQMADRTPRQLFDYLKSCDGLLVFVDPGWQKWQSGHLSYDQLLYQLLEDLRDYRQEHDQPEPKIALCMVKVDGNGDLWNGRHVDGEKLCSRHSGNGKDWCLGHCSVVDYLGQQFMFHRLPGLISTENVACFMVSSIGRVDDDPNTSMGRPWKRSTTPRPFTFKNQVNDPAFSESITDMPVIESYTPLSINRVDRIAPHNLLGPINWMLAE